MKKKNLFILIGVVFIIGILFLIWWLGNLQKPLNEKHISINFEIHNCSAVESKTDQLRNDFLKPLLRHSVVTEKNGLENLFLTKVSCNNVSFCIPAIGINSLRYASEKDNLKESSMTSVSREKDEETFFNDWTANGFTELEKVLLGGHPAHKNNTKLPTLDSIKRQDPSDDIIQDSIIIDKNCVQEQSPYIFKSAENARNYINGVLLKNPEAIKKGTVNSTIHFFLYCGDIGDSPDPKEPITIENPSNQNTDTDGDGIPDISDECDTVKGDKKCDGCPCEQVGEKDPEVHPNEINGVLLTGDRTITWNGEKSDLTINISIPTLKVSIQKNIQKNSTIPLNYNEKKQLLQIEDGDVDRILIQYLEPKTRKWINVGFFKKGNIHCYNLFDI